MRVLITGCSAHLADALIPRLLAEPRVREIVGVDLKPPRVHDPRLRFVRCDVRDPGLAEHLSGIDALIHLAFVVMQGDLGARRHDRALMHDINVGGSRNAIGLAANNGVATVVQLSSAAVYALPALAPHISEDHPRAALPGFAYAEDKIAVETWLDDFERQHRPMRIVRLRPHVILGPRSQPLLRAFVRAPFYLRLPDPQPPIQCVHEDDVAEAVRLALFGEARGPFNLATADALPFRALQRAIHRLALPLPHPLLAGVLHAAWRGFGWGTDPAWLAGLRHPPVLDVSRARAVLGWTPRFTCSDTFRAAL